MQAEGTYGFTIIADISVSAPGVSQASFTVSIPGPFFIGNITSANVQMSQQSFSFSVSQYNALIAY